MPRWWRWYGRFGRLLATALRTFLLTLAVVDDLLAIVLIAAFYPALLALVPLFGGGHKPRSQRRRSSKVLLGRAGKSGRQWVCRG